jgi:folate-binding protein YgfZ
MTPTQLQTELAAIRTGAAIYPLTDRAFLRITGPDATRWLNGMVTNNIAALAPGEGNYNFLLNAQGRIQGDCTIYRELGEEPTFLLETDKSQIDTIHQLLDKFIIMDDVELSPALADEQGLLIIGAGALGTLDVGCLWPPAPISLSRHGWDAPDPMVLAVAKDQYEVWGSPSTISWLSSLGERQISPETIEAHRILTATPKYGVDIRNTETNKDLPQETAQTHALHFAKGCYLGQEIVERIRSRGQVHRTFTQFRLTGTLPDLPAKLEANGKPAGELTSAIQIGPDILALGYARREALDSNHPLTYPGGTALPTTNH